MGRRPTIAIEDLPSQREATEAPPVQQTKAFGRSQRGPASKRQKQKQQSSSTTTTTTSQVKLNSIQLKKIAETSATLLPWKRKATTPKPVGVQRRKLNEKIDVESTTEASVVAAKIKRKHFPTLPLEENIPGKNANVKGYQCQYCEAVSLTPCRRIEHLHACHKHPQYVVQAALRGFRRVDVDEYYCLFCDCSAKDRRDRIESHIKTKHKNFIKFASSGTTYEINNDAFNEIFFGKHKNKEVTMATYRSFANLTMLLENFEIQNVGHETIIVDKLRDYCTDFMKKFATHEQLNEVRTKLEAVTNKLDQQSDEITAINDRHARDNSTVNTTINEHGAQIKAIEEKVKIHDNSAAAVADALSAHTAQIKSVEDKIKKTEEKLKVVVAVKSNEQQAMHIAASHASATAAPLQGPGPINSNGSGQPHLTTQIPFNVTFGLNLNQLDNMCFHLMLLQGIDINTVSTHYAAYMVVDLIKSNMKLSNVENTSNENEAINIIGIPDVTNAKGNTIPTKCSCKIFPQPTGRKPRINIEIIDSMGNGNLLRTFLMKNVPQLLNEKFGAINADVVRFILSRIPRN